MKDNKGFSMVELIVVIAVMAILVISAVSLTGAQSGWKVNRAAEMMDSAMNRTMTQAMSKGGTPSLLIYELNGTYYAVLASDSCKTGVSTYAVTEDKVLQRYELGRAPMRITFSYTGTMGETVPSVTLADQSSEGNLTSVAELTFERTTGAIKKVTVGGVECYYTGVSISLNGRAADIEIHSATGRHEIL